MLSSLWLLWHEFRAGVQKRDLLLVTDGDNEIDAAIAVEVAEVSRDLLRVGLLAEGLRPGVDHGFGRIAGGQLDDEHAALQVDEFKIRGPGRAIVVVPHDMKLLCYHRLLEGGQLGCLLLMLVDGRCCEHQQDHDGHAQAEDEQSADSAPGFPLSWSPWLGEALPLLGVQDVAPTPLLND